jgi:hypothetical protein
MMPGSERGSSLVEVLIAALIMTTGVATMAQLVAVATASNSAARRNTVATILAEQKLEQLRALTWAYDVAGLPVDDLSTDTTTTPESSGGTGLQTSPSSALSQNTPGFVDHIGLDGQIVGRGTQVPRLAVYTRRWSIERVSAAPDTALIIQVLVTVPGAGSGGGRRERGEARVITVKARKGQ